MSNNDSSNNYECRTCLQQIDIKSSNCVKPCNCTDGYHHKECLERWINTSNATKCLVCNAEYNCIQKKKCHIPWCPLITSLLFEILIWIPAFFDNDYINKVGFMIGILATAIPWIIFGQYYDDVKKEKSHQSRKVVIAVE